MSTVITQANGQIMKSSINMGEYSIFISCCFIESSIDFHHLVPLAFPIKFVTFPSQFLIFLSIATNRPIESWNVSQISNMSFLFLSKENCNPNIAEWDVSKVTEFVSECV
jgi:hypothetical protein